MKIKIILLDSENGMKKEMEGFISLALNAST